MVPDDDPPIGPRAAATRADTELREQPLAARIPQALDARQARPPPGESLVIDVVTRHGARLRHMRSGNPAKTVEGGRFSH
jgi:hypothetical protein